MAAEAGCQLLPWLVRATFKVTFFEAINVVEQVSLLLRVVPDLVNFSRVINGLHELIELTVSVHALPDRLTVGWVVSTSVILLTNVEDK